MSFGAIPQMISRDEARKLLAAPKRNKFGARRTNGYASKKECAYCEGLKIQAKAGIITDLVLQPRYPLVVNGNLVCTYVADARFKDANGCLHIIDAKGKRTREYITKKKLFEALHRGLKIEEV